MLKAALRDSLVYGLASVISRGLSIFLLPLYTRVLSPSDYGAYDLLITLCALANLGVALEISQGLARHWADTEEQGTRVRLASTSLWFTVLMYGLFLIIGLLAAPWLNAWIIGDEGYLDAFRLGIGFIAANGIYYFLLNQFRWELRSKTYAVVSFVYALLTLLLAATFCLLLQMGICGVMLAQLLAALTAAILCIWLLRRTFELSFDSRQLVALLKFSAPLVPAGLSVFISLYVNRFALNHFGGLEDVGLYGVGNRIAGLSSLMILGVQSAITPLVYKYYREKETPGNIAQLFNWFMAIALPGCLFLALFSKELLTVFATPKYMAVASLVALLAPALLLSQMYIFAPGIAIAKKTRWQLWVTIMSAATSIVANFLFVPLWGMWGAAVATLLTSLVFFLSWLLLSQKLYLIPYEWRPCMFALIAYLICALLGLAVDESGQTMLIALVLKSLLLSILLMTVVAFGLLPVADLDLLFSRFQLRLRLSRRV